MLWSIIYVPYELADGGAARWADIKEEVADRMLERFQHFIPDLTPERVTAREVDSPIDMKAYSPSFQRGDTHGLGSQIFHTAGYRPTIDLAQYAVPGVERFTYADPSCIPMAASLELAGPLRSRFARILASISISW